MKDGDFLVRESVTSPGQFVLSGLQGGQAKHLLLVDPEGKVRLSSRHAPHCICSVPERSRLSVNVFLNHTASSSSMVSIGSRPGAPCGGQPLSVLNSVQQDKPVVIVGSCR